MATPICEGCGGQTNSTLSDYWDLKTEYAKATVCYAKHDGKRWVKGCGFDKADDFSRKFALDVIEGDN